MGGLSKGGTGEDEMSPELLLPYSSFISPELTLKLRLKAVGSPELVRNGGRSL